MVEMVKDEVEEEGALRKISSFVVPAVLMSCLFKLYNKGVEIDILKCIMR